MYTYIYIYYVYIYIYIYMTRRDHSRAKRFIDKEKYNHLLAFFQKTSGDFQNCGN